MPYFIKTWNREDVEVNRSLRIEPELCDSEPGYPPRRQVSTEQPYKTAVTSQWPIKPVTPWLIAPDGHSKTITWITHFKTLKSIGGGQDGFGTGGEGEGKGREGREIGRGGHQGDGRGQQDGGVQVGRVGEEGWGGC